MSLKSFFRDPFHRGMSLLFVAHVLTLVWLIDVVGRLAPRQPPDCLAPILFMAGVGLMLFAIAKL